MALELFLKSIHTLNQKVGVILQENNLIQAIRSEVEQNIGRTVVVRADKGRKRIVTKEGVIENAFDDVFTVRISNSFDMERTVSYTYTDVLTSTVKLTVY